MITGFFRVTKIKQHGRYYYKYSVRNKLVKKELMANDMKKLKDKSETKEGKFVKQKNKPKLKNNQKFNKNT